MLLLDALVLGVLASVLGLVLGEMLSRGAVQLQSRLSLVRVPDRRAADRHWSSIALAVGGGMLAAGAGVLAAATGAAIVERPRFERRVAARPIAVSLGCCLSPPALASSATTVILLAAHAGGDRRES